MFDKCETKKKKRKKRSICSLFAFIVVAVVV